VLTPRIAACLGLLIPCALVGAQTPPTSYTITQNGQSRGATSTTYRSGSKVLLIFNQPAQILPPHGLTASMTLQPEPVLPGTPMQARSNAAWAGSPATGEIHSA
jgi:hypothetical protein